MPVGYALTQDSELWAIDPGKRHNVLDRRTIKDAGITDMKGVQDGHRLLLCDTRNDLSSSWIRPRTNR